MQQKTTKVPCFRSSLRHIKDINFKNLMQLRYAIQLLLCACACQLCTAHQCGDNPMMLVKQKFELHGLDFENEVTNLPPGHVKKLKSEVGKYLDCIRSVETGYFKRKRTYDPQDSFASLRATSLQDVGNSLQSARLQESGSQLFDKYDEVFKQFLRTDQPSRDYEGDDIMSEFSRNSLTDTLLTKDDVSRLVKRLLRYKLPKRINIMNDEDFLDV